MVAPSFGAAHALHDFILSGLPGLPLIPRLASYWEQPEILIHQDDLQHPAIRRRPLVAALLYAT
jgi:hypothetical protein